jgi:ribosome maturation factor RimP
MDSIISKLEELIKKEMDKMDIILDSIVWIEEKNNNTLRVILDKVNGIDLDTIVEATNIINPILDETDLIDEQYTLEVSSKERGN